MLSDILLHPVVAMILLLGALVFFHELGHYLMAKAFGIGVETFSIGFGPRLFSLKYNHTVYQLALIPLGGYVKLAGSLAIEDVPEEFRGKEMYKAARWQRALVLFAGPLANFILAVAVYVVLGFAGIEHPAPVVGTVRPGTPAASAGLLPGDRFLSINGQKILTWSDMQKIVSKSPEKNLQIKILRQNNELNLNIVPSLKWSKNIFGKKEQQGRLGIGLGYISSFITIMNQNSTAYLSGLRTGDKVLSMSWIKKNDQVEKKILRHWHDLETSVRLFLLSGSEKFTLDVLRAQNKRKTFSIHLKSLQRELLEPKKFLFDLGVVDSQLTIAEIEKVNGISQSDETSLQVGDRVLSFAGKALKDIYSLYDLLIDNRQKRSTISVVRNGLVTNLVIDLKQIEQQRPEGKVVTYTLPARFMGQGVHPPRVLEKYTDVMSALSFALKTTYDQSFALTRALGGLFSGQVPLQSLGGPILIAKVAGDSAKAGWQTFLSTMAIISINLGIVNLFPIPVLDGGQLVILFFESIRRKPLSPQAIEGFFKVGFVMIMSLVILATYNDLSRFWAAMLKGALGAGK